VLEHLLRAAVPALPVRVLATGVGGDDSRQMVARIGRDVLPLRPALVVWQTGTNDVPHGLPLDSLARLIATGVGQMRGAGIEVLLLDAQVAPAFMVGEAAATRFAAVQHTLQVAGTAAGVTTMPRFAWSRAVLASGQLRLIDLVAPDGLHPTDLGHACAARLLATGLVHSAVVALEVPTMPLPSDPAP
jgi:lysophospholipase L1-like esterase